MALLTIDDVSVGYRTDEGPDVEAVSDVSFEIHEGETFGLVGESGCGKTTLAKAILQLLDANGYVASGEIRYGGRDLAALPKPEIREVRWAEISTIPQASMSGLNPVYRVGDQIAEAILRHEPETTEREADERARRLLERVGVDAERADDYAHEFSGGMKQRVVIAMALAADPDLLICDEPTTALDVTIQAQILRLLDELKREYDTSIVFITHDLGVVAEIADRVVVMYAGKVMERAGVYDLFEAPAHPYTQALLDCLLGTGRELGAIEGSPPKPTDPPAGCRFHPRCPHAVEDCRVGDQPPLHPVDAGDGSPDHAASCLYYGDGYDASVVRRGDPAVEEADSRPGGEE